MKDYGIVCHMKFFILNFEAFLTTVYVLDKIWTGDLYAPLQWRMEDMAVDVVIYRFIGEK